MESATLLKTVLGDFQQTEAVYLFIVTGLSSLNFFTERFASTTLTVQQNGGY